MCVTSRLFAVYFCNIINNNMILKKQMKTFQSLLDRKVLVVTMYHTSVGQLNIAWKSSRRGERRVLMHWVQYARPGWSHHQQKPEPSCPVLQSTWVRVMKRARAEAAMVKQGEDVSLCPNIDRVVGGGVDEWGDGGPHQCWCWWSGCRQWPELSGFRATCRQGLNVLFNTNLWTPLHCNTAQLYLPLNRFTRIHSHILELFFLILYPTIPFVGHGCNGDDKHTISTLTAANVTS